MSFIEVAVKGTLKPDGTLELNQKPNLSPGRVQIVLRQETSPTPSNEDWFQHLQRLRAAREANDYPFLNEKEANDYIEWLRGGS
jgi:hypothetical protein